MGEFFVALPPLLLAILVGYVLGAIPLAYQVARLHGVDIFSAGTGLAGATNVRKAVGRIPGLVVLVGDLGKGALAVIIGNWLGVEAPWILVPAAAAVFGQWKSVFTWFRGGDGMATFGGSILAMFPLFGLISIGVALLVSLGGQRLPYSSLLNIVFGYATLVWLNMAFDGDTVLVLGVGGISGLVLVYAILGHRRRRQVAGAAWHDVDEQEGATQQSGFNSQ